MAKRSKKPIKKQEHVEKDAQQIVDKSTKWLQGIALVGAIAIIILSGSSESFTVTPYVVPVLLGIAVGLNPDQFKEIIVETIKAVIGRGKK